MVEPWRTSPAANSPGTLVSSASGSRSSGQPAGRRPPSQQVGTGEDVAGAVGAHAALGRPARPRLPAEAQEQRLRGQPLAAFGGVRDRRPGEVPVVGVQLAHLGLQPHVDQRVGLDARDQILGHALAEPVATDEQLHPRACIPQVHRGLSRGVPGADDEDVVAAALSGLAAPGAVVDPAAEQLVDAVDLEPPPLHPRGGEGDVGRHLVAAVDGQAHRGARRQRAADDAAEQDQLGAEALRLATGQPCQLGAADALREAEEVLDQRGVRRLSARDVAVEDDGRQAVGGGVHGRRQTRGAGADDRQVVVVARRSGRDRPCGGKTRGGGAGVNGVTVDHHGQLGLTGAGPRQQLVGLGRAGLVELVRLRDPREEVAQPVVRGLQPAPDDAHGRADRAHSPGRTNISSSS